MALVGKPGLLRRLYERHTLPEQSTHRIELAHRAKAPGTGAKRRPKLPRQRPSVEAGHLLEVRHRMTCDWI